MPNQSTGIAPFPPNPKNPIGGTALIKAARVGVNRSLRATQAWLLQTLVDIPTTRITVNATPLAPPQLQVHASVYEYQISGFGLEQIVTELKRRLYSDDVSEPVVSRAVAGYEIGTAAEVTGLAAITSDYTRTVTQVLSSEPWQRRVALMRSRVFEEMQGFSGETATDLARVLSQGIESGFNPLDVAKTVRDRFGVARSRAEKIARSEITGALRRARWDEAEDARINVGIRTMEMHLSALSPSTRQSHAARHGNLYSVQEIREWYSRDGNGINCYLPDTKVRGRFIGGSKAHYSGNAFRIVTASGRNLSVTPNHPVMTDFGLVPACKITEGCNLVAYIGQEENLTRVSDLNSELADSRIEDVFSSLVDIGHTFNRRVVGVDFHGDGARLDKDIQVVNSKRVLTSGVNADASEVLDNLSLVEPYSVVSESDGSLFLDSIRVYLSAPSFLRSACKFLSVFFGGLSHSLVSTLRAVSVFKTFFVEPSVKGDSGNSGFFANLKDRLSRNVLCMKVMNVIGVFNASGLSPTKADGLKKLSDRALRDADIVSDSLHAFSGLISIDKVVSVESFFHSGHVYDLQELSGIMIANNIVASNCKCSQVSVLVDEEGNPLQERVVKRVKGQKVAFEEKQAKA